VLLGKDAGGLSALTIARLVFLLAAVPRALWGFGHGRDLKPGGDFVPWRFSAAGRWSAGLDPRYRRPKTI
jgi:hypothetical protein